MNTRSRFRERGTEPPRVEEFMRDNQMLYGKKPGSKRKPLQAVSCSSSSSSHHSSNKENANESNVINQMVKDDEGTLKKFKMSSDEKHMNGAPEGELYDVTVLKDNELKELHGTDEEIASNLMQAFANGSTPSSSWADRFSAVELLRRTTRVKRHASILENDYVLLVAALESCTHAVGSLRSCSVRNGLLAINALIRTVPLILSYEHGSTLLNALMSGKLLTSGPKFICESATNLIEDIASLMEPMVAVKCFALSIDHKNPHVSNTAFCSVAKAVLAVPQAVTDSWKDGLGSSSGVDRDTMEILSLLYKGLSTKWPSGRELCRRAFQFLQERMGHSFAALAGACLSEHQCLDVRRAISQKTGGSNSGFSSSSSSPGASGQGMSRTVPYHKVEGRLDNESRPRPRSGVRPAASSGISGGASGLSSSGRLKDQMRADRRAFLEKERPATSSVNQARKPPAGGIFIFEDM